MVDDPDTAAELVSGGYEVSKSSVRRSAGSGVEVRVRAVRRRNWSTEDKLRIVRETLAPGAGAKAVAGRDGVGAGPRWGAAGPGCPASELVDRGQAADCAGDAGARRGGQGSSGAARHWDRTAV